MSLKALVNAIYNAQVGLGSVRYRQEPTAAAGVAVADDSAWDQIIAGTILTTDHWLVGLNVGDAALTGADTEEVLAEGIGGVDGAAVAAATLLVEVDLNMGAVGTPAAEMVWEPPIYFPVPMLCSTSVVANGTRHAAEISTSITGGVALNVGITYITGLGA